MCYPETGHHIDILDDGWWYLTMRVSTQEERRRLMLEERRQRELKLPRTEPVEPATPQTPESEPKEQPQASSPPNSPVGIKWPPQSSVKNPENIFSLSPSYLQWERWPWLNFRIETIIPLFQCRLHNNYELYTTYIDQHPKLQDLIFPIMQLYIVCVFRLCSLLWLHSLINMSFKLHSPIL